MRPVEGGSTVFEQSMRLGSPLQLDPRARMVHEHQHWCESEPPSLPRSHHEDGGYSMLCHIAISYMWLSAEMCNTTPTDIILIVRSAVSLITAFWSLTFFGLVLFLAMLLCIGFQSVSVNPPGCVGNFLHGGGFDDPAHVSKPRECSWNCANAHNYMRYPHAVLCCKMY